MTPVTDAPVQLASEQSPSGSWLWALVPQKISEALLITLLPVFVSTVVHGSVVDVGNVSALVSFAGVIGSILWGNLTDRLGQRCYLLLLGFLGFSLSVELLSESSRVMEVLILGVSCGFSLSAIAPVTSALIVDSYPGSELSRWFGRFYLLNGGSFVIAALGGALLLKTVSPELELTSILRSLFQAAGIGAIASTLLSLVLIKDPEKPVQERRFTSNLADSLSVAVVERRALVFPSRLFYFVWSPTWLHAAKIYLQPPLSWFYLGAACFVFASGLVHTPFPLFLIEELHMSSSQMLWIVLGKASVETLLYVPIGHWIRHRLDLTLLIQGTAVRIVVYGLLAAVAMYPQQHTFVIVLILHMLSGVVWAAMSISITSAVAKLAPVGAEGMAMGIVNAIMGLATVVGSLIAGNLVAHWSYATCFTVAAVFSGLTALLLWQIQTLEVETLSSGTTEAS